MALHILQAGIENGDQKRIERAAKRGLRARRWIAPKGAKPGDEAVIYIGRFGFFATGRIDSVPVPCEDWPNRYSAAVKGVRLIAPPISLPIIQREVPDLTWANYPRNITTPAEDVAQQIRDLVRRRRTTRLPELNDETIETASLEELRAVAMMRSGTTTAMSRETIYRLRARAVRNYVLKRADGTCEGCKRPAPFFREDGSPYLEPHHIHRMADGGPDLPWNVSALCPNCHKRAHHSADRTDFKKRLERTINAKEPR